VTEDPTGSSGPCRSDDGQAVLLDCLEFADRGEVGQRARPEPHEGLVADHVLQLFITDVGAGGFFAENQAMRVGG